VDEGADICLPSFLLLGSIPGHPTHVCLYLLAKYSHFITRGTERYNLLPGQKAKKKKNQDLVFNMKEWILRKETNQF
jgi:hypothetical protein